MRQVFCKVKLWAFDRLVKFPVWVIHSEHSYPRQIILILCRNVHATARVKSCSSSTWPSHGAELLGERMLLYYIAYGRLFTWIYSYVGTASAMLIIRPTRQSVFQFAYRSKNAGEGQEGPCFELCCATRLWISHSSTTLTHADLIPGGETSTAASLDTAWWLSRMLLSALSLNKS